MNNNIDFLQDGERLDDLQLDGRYIISHKDKYCFTSDSVMLANLVSSNSKSEIVDLCCGGGIISILIGIKFPCKHITGVELQDDMADMANRSVQMNNLTDKITILKHDVKDISSVINNGSVDIVVCNPPYYKINNGAVRQNNSVAMARHEVALTLEQLVASTAKILKFGGMFYLIHKAERMAEVLTCLTEHNLIPKKLYNITTGNSDKVDTFIVVSKLGGKHGMEVKNIKHD